jgi:tRNA threonylcarbamoyladenosine biosynthesis protein TsaB
MTIILAIETSSEIASAALIRGRNVVQQQTSGVMNHSQQIIPMVQTLLTEAGIGLADCDAIAFGAGPGSFTGVRTACGVVQGLAFGAGLPVIPVVTLLALAQAQRVAAGATNLVVALDARMSEVYWAHYGYDEKLQSWQTVVAPTLSAPQHVVVAGRAGYGPAVLVGNGFIAYADKFDLPAALLASATDALPQASAIATLAQVEFAHGRILAAEAAQPLYLRNKIALTSAERLALTG